MPPEKFQLVQGPVAPISAHAWNANRTEVAISPNSNEVKIYSYKGGNYTLLHTLGEHTQSVTAIDWSAATDRIVTCSQDRNAYVWNRTKVDGKEVWAPVLVILRINRAATCVKWSPLGNKFAVGSGSRLISVCYYEEANDWWVSKHIKKPIRSTVTCLDWHPGNILIGAGGTDFKVRVFSGYIKECEEKPAATNWGKKLPFGEVLGEYSTSSFGGGWVHSVSFSASGDQLAYVAHDCSVSVVDATQDFKVTRFSSPDLPYLCVTWLGPKSLICAGYDYTPYAYNYDGSSLKHLGRLDVAEKKETKALSAMDKFKTLDRKGTIDAATTDTAVSSIHQNAIKELSIFSGDKNKVTKYCTVGVDGQIILWDLAESLRVADVKLL